MQLQEVKSFSAQCEQITQDLVSFGISFIIFNGQTSIQLPQPIHKEDILAVLFSK